jgi:hypothetical protein
VRPDGAYRGATPGTRGLTAILGFLASWCLALRYQRHSEDGKITAEYRVLMGARAVAAFLIVLFLSGIGPAASAIMGAFLAGVLVSTALVVVLWTVDRPPFRSPVPERLSDGSWV